MKISTFFVLLATSFVALSCSNNNGGGNEGDPVVELSSLTLSNVKTDYIIGDSFVKPTVTAFYSDESSKVVTDDCTFSNYDLTIQGSQSVLVTYETLTTSYTILVKRGDNSGSNEGEDIGEDIIEGDFSIKVSNEGETPTVENKVYKITAAGTYTLSGKLENGQIYVDAEGFEVEIVLAGVSISNDLDSPIFINKSDSVDIKVKKGTENFIYDNRSSYNSEDGTGAGAIYCKDGDLKIKGTGKLAVIAYANNAIHGKDDVTIKNATLVLRAVNNGIKGNDSVTIEETPVIDIICGNDGIKTENTDVSSKGKQRGNVTITGGEITINSYADGISAAYSAIISEGETEDDDGNIIVTTPSIDIYTNIYSLYNANTLSDVSKTYRPGPGGGEWGGGSSTKAAESAKGIKACEDLNISAGRIFIEAYDDGLHGNQTSDDVQIVFENGENAKGNVTITGGDLKINASDDGIHADGTTSISGGTIYVGPTEDNSGFADGSHEGIEGNVLNISGGSITVFANDDGLNAGSEINISGGLVDVTVSPSGDKDGIDSNGTITITGGTTITRGPNSENMSPIDAEGQISINGGTLVVVGRDTTNSGGGYRPGPGGPGGGGGGWTSISVGNGVSTTVSSSGLSFGSHTVTFSSSEILYTNSYSYSGAVTIYSVLGSASVK